VRRRFAFGTVRIDRSDLVRLWGVLCSLFSPPPARFDKPDSIKADVDLSVPTEGGFAEKIGPDGFLSLLDRPAAREGIARGLSFDFDIRYRRTPPPSGLFISDHVDRSLTVDIANYQGVSVTAEGEPEWVARVEQELAFLRSKEYPAKRIQDRNIIFIRDVPSEANLEGSKGSGPVSTAASQEESWIRKWAKEVAGLIVAGIVVAVVLYALTGHLG
jgi:hypothetical protein